MDADVAYSKLKAIASAVAPADVASSIFSSNYRKLDLGGPELDSMSASELLWLVDEGYLRERMRSGRRTYGFSPFTWERLTRSYLKGWGAEGEEIWVGDTVSAGDSVGVVESLSGEDYAATIAGGSGKWIANVSELHRVSCGRRQVRDTGRVAP